MSYRKAEQLLALATLVAGRHVGVTLDDVIERFGVSKRTAQRMLRALETVFPDTVSTVDEQGRKRWRLPSAALRDLMTLSAEELATFDLAIETMKRSGLTVDAEDLLSLREKIMALVPRSKAAAAGRSGDRSWVFPPTWSRGNPGRPTSSSSATPGRATIRFSRWIPAACF